MNVDDDLRVLSTFPPPTPEEVMEALPRYNPVPSGASNVIVRADALADIGPVRPEPAADRGLGHVDQVGEHRAAGVRASSAGGISLPHVEHRGRDGGDRGRAGSPGRPGTASRWIGAAMQRRAAWTCLRAGNRSGAVRHYARAARLGDVKSLARAAVALVHPAAGSDRIFGLLRGSRMDERWRAEAQAWLDELSRLQTTLMNPSKP